MFVIVEKGSFSSCFSLIQQFQNFNEDGKKVAVELKIIYTSFLHFETSFLNENGRKLIEFYIYW